MEGLTKELRGKAGYGLPVTLSSQKGGTGSDAAEGALATTLTKPSLEPTDEQGHLRAACPAILMGFI